MSNITERRLKEIMLCCAEHGDYKAIETYNISPSTLERYKRQDRHDSTYIPKVLLFDIETTPCKGLFWHTGKQYISHNNIVQPWNVLSWAAKWLFSSEMMEDVLTPQEAISGDDKRIVKSMWDLLEIADVVIAHNGDQFDLKRLNTRFILNGLTPPRPYQSIDTLKIARKHFSFSSNRLDYLGKLMKDKGKIKTDFDLWVQCIAGDKKSLDYMIKYNKMDVELLEEVYLELRPWCKSHPNMGLYVDSDKEVCPNCGNDNLDWGGYYTTMVGKYAAFRCGNCGAIGRCRTTALSKEQRDRLTVSIAR